MRKCGNIERSQHALPVPDLMVLQKTFSQEKNALDLVQKKTLESHLEQPQAMFKLVSPKVCRKSPAKAAKGSEARLRIEGSGKVSG